MQIKSQKIKPIVSLVLLIMVIFFCQPSPVGGAPIVNTDKEIYNYGEMIKVNFFNAPGYERDWICVVPAGSPDNVPGDYKYIPQGLNKGILTFDSPSPGKYEVRAYYNYSIFFVYAVSARHSFSVTSAAQVKTDKEIYNYGEMIKVNFFNAPGYERDWICIVPAGSPDNVPGDYKYIPQGLNKGILTFDSPSPGKYEVRAYYNHSILNYNEYVVSARHGFSVVAGGPPGKSERSSPAKEVDVNFIPSPRLSNNNFNHLWTVATNKCNDFGWPIANSDKTKRDLICQSQSSSSTMTLRVKFADEGIYVDVLMSSAEWASFGGKGLVSRIKEYREMKKALQDALSEVQSSQKEIVVVDPIVNQQISKEKTAEKPNGTPTMESKPASSEKNRKSIITEQVINESSPQSMTTTQIQQRLSELGYQPGPSDGKIGKRTTEALKKFQQDNNLPVMGKADNETVNKLRQKKAKDKKEQYVKPRTLKPEAPMKSEPVKAGSPLDL